MASVFDRPVERDVDIEIIRVDESLSSKQKRIKLLDFLIQCPPPEPLHWTSFHDYIVKHFNSFYPEKIIKDVFQHIDRAITKKRYVSAVIDLDSDEEHASSNNEGRGNRDSSCLAVPQPIADTESINDAFSGSVEDADDSCTFNILDDSPISREDFEEFRRNPTVKNYSKLLKDIYSLIKEINESTSCRVCSKLRYRYVKYTEMVSKDSELLKKTRSDQETADAAHSSSLIQRMRRKSSTENRENSYFQLMRSKFLTEKEADKIRESILMDKLMELSYPDVLTSAESIQPTQSDMANREAGAPQHQKPKKSKKKSLSEPVPPDSSGAKEAEKKRSKNSESAVPPKKKRGRPKKSLHSIGDDEQPGSIVEVIEPTPSGDDTQIRRKKSPPQTERIEEGVDLIGLIYPDPSGDDTPTQRKKIFSQARRFEKPVDLHDPSPSRTNSVFEAWWMENYAVWAAGYPHTIIHSNPKHSAVNVLFDLYRHWEVAATLPKKTIPGKECARCSREV